MKADSSTEFDTETPMHMIEPINDSIFSVVPVITRMMATPQTTPGTAPIEISPSRNDWKKPVNKTRITTTDRARPMVKRLEHLRHRRNLAADADAHSARRLAGVGDGLRMRPVARPRSSPSILAVMLK